MSKPILKIIGTNGDKYMLLAKARMKLFSYGYPIQKIEEFEKEAMKGDYNDLLETLDKWFNIQ